MLKKHIILIAVILFVSGCNSSSTQKDKYTEGAPTSVSQTSGRNPLVHDHLKLDELSVDQLNAINRSLSATARENFRSWNYIEPERWEYLSDKFAEEVVLSCPDASSKKKEIATTFLSYLTQRAKIYSSDAKDKQELMGRSSAEFKYNLSFLIGIEGYQKWQSQSKTELQKFSQLADSLREVIACTSTKIKELKIKTP